MIRKFLPRLTYANVLATVAVFVALGGTASAAFIVTSNSDVAQNTISGHNPPSGDHANLLKHSVTDVDLTAAVKGARAYGLYTNFLSHDKNVVGVRNPSDGIYCIQLDSSIDPSKASLIAGSDFTSDNTSDGGNQVSHAEWESSGADCNSGEMEVRTWIDFNDTQQQSVTGCAGCTVTDTFRNLELTDQGFVFVVP